MAHRDQSGLGQDGADRELGDGAGVAPGRVDDRHAAGTGGLHVDVHRPAARDADQLQLRAAVEQPAVHRRQMGDQDLGVGQEVHDVLGPAHELLQPLERVAGIAVAHRLVGPGKLLGADVEIGTRDRAQGAGEDLGLHETVADHGHLRHGRYPRGGRGRDRARPRTWSRSRRGRPGRGHRSGGRAPDRAAPARPGAGRPIPAQQAAMSG